MPPPAPTPTPASRRLLPVVAVAVGAALLAPAGAAVGQSQRDLREERERIRETQVEAAMNILALSATDLEVEAALAVLEENVGIQQAAVGDAHQAAAAAHQHAATAAADVAASLAEIDRLEAQLDELAVQAYVQHAGSAGEGDALLRSRDLGEVPLRRALYSQATQRELDVGEQLRETNAVLDEQRNEAEAAARSADDAEAAAAAELAELEEDEAQTEHLRSELEARIADYHTLVDALEAQDSFITAVIQERDAARRSELGIGDDNYVEHPPSASGLVWPVQGKLTSPYGQRWGRLHAGIDIAAPTGTPIRAANSGEVIYAGWRGGYGNAVIVDHGDGLATLYGHMSRIGARTGQTVDRGEVIGAVGSTGNSTGPHLHFETRIGGRPRDPQLYLP